MCPILTVNIPDQFEKEFNETLTQGIKEKMQFAEKCTEFIGVDLIIMEENDLYISYTKHHFQQGQYK